MTNIRRSIERDLENATEDWQREQLAQEADDQPDSEHGPQGGRCSLVALLLLGSVATVLAAGLYWL